jgi:hypothetical protein
MPVPPTPPATEPVSSGDLYRVAVDEYRFQSQFNWSRTQYFLAFNAAILATGVGLTRPSGGAAVLVYGLGIVAAGVTWVVVRTQHDYYRAARDRMRRIEAELAVPDQARIDTTASLGGRKRIASVNQLVSLLLVAVALADIIGIVLALT